MLLGFLILYKLTYINEDAENIRLFKQVHALVINGLKKLAGKSSVEYRILTSQLAICYLVSLLMIIQLLHLMFGVLLIRLICR